MKFKLLAAVASVALMSAGLAAHAQENPKTEQRPAAERAQPKAETAPRAGAAMKGEAMKNESPKAAARGESPNKAQEAPNKAAQTQRQEGPKAAQTQRQETPKAAQTQRQEGPKAAQAGQKESPKAAAGQPNQMQRQGEARPNASTPNRAAGNQPNMKTGAAANRQNQAQGAGGPARATGKVRMSSEHAQRVGAALRRDGRPENVNVNVRVGERIPESVMIRPLPEDVVSIVPEYRGYDYFIDSEDEVVFVSPETHEIVGTIDYEGRAAAEDATQVSGAPRPCPAND